MKKASNIKEGICAPADKNSIPAASIEITTRVAEGRKALDEGRLKKEVLWGKGMTVLDSETIKLPLVIRKALAIKRIITEMPISIGDHELIVGRVRYGNMQSVFEGANSFPAFATEDEIAAAAKLYTGPLSMFGHFCPSYYMYLEKGLGGLRKKAEDRIKELKDGEEDADKRAWYKAVIISLDALGQLMKRYSDLALAIASKTRNLVRKGELQKISETCERLVISPPQTFYEALQAVWFLHSALYSQFLLLPFGRPDQYLYPFLKNDLDNGRLTMGEAQELIDLFVLKCCEPLKRYKRTLEAVQDSQHSDLNTNPISFERIAELLGAFSAYGGGKTTQDSIGLDGGTYTQLMQTVTLAGVKPNGEDATNSVSYLFLNSALRLKVPSPAMYLRLGDQSPAELLERAADCLRAGCVSPSIYSDKAIVPAYVKAGISLEDARQYAASGCQETYIEGKTYFKYGIISAAEAVSRVISPAYWERMVAPLIYLEEFDPCKEAGPDPRTFRSFEEVMSAVKMRLDQLVKGFIYSSVTLRDGRLSKISPEPLLSAVVPGPLDKGLDLTTEYAMPYSIHSPLLVGLSHAADSLAVIKKLCFDDCSVSISELLDAVDSNWEGSETLRQIVRTRVPAYGNDIDYVDNLAKELTDSYVQSMRSHSAKYSSRVIFLPGMFTGELYIALGKIIPALPDGRRAGEPLGTNGSPSIGRPERGEAAAINSFVKLPLDDLAGVCGLDIDMEGSAGSPARLAQLEYIIEAFSDAPGNLLTVTVNNCEDLRKAQKEPEKYRNLIVRVAGHLAYFVDLPPHHQERLIMRAEQYARGC